MPAGLGVWMTIKTTKITQFSSHKQPLDIVALFVYLFNKKKKEPSLSSCSVKGFNAADE
jgi:hypothetical protein